jgi:hypothetical protein
MAIGCTLILTWWLREPASALGTQANKVPIEKKYYYGKGECARCHNQGEAKVDGDYSNICRMTEVAYWEKDKHKRAWLALENHRAEQMRKILGWDFMKDKRCTSCHGVDAADSLMDEPYRKTKYQEGVTCVVCHGPYEEWVEKHGGGGKEWRALTRQQKETKYGMFDLWSASKRTQVCASCHIGNVDEGKVVTHQMYAAGHPPLPSFEVVAFSEQMPRHWEYLKEKNPDRLKLLKPPPIDPALEETHLTAVGSLVVFQESVRLLQQQAAKSELEWPEVAHYDCYACHHELTSKNWRQQRGYAGKPGRPPLHFWPSALVKLGIIHASADSTEADILDKEYRARFKQLQQALDAEPFGNREIVQAKAKALVGWTEDRLAKIQKDVLNASAKNIKKYQEDTPQRLLTALFKNRNEFIPDYDSARQLSWTFAALHRDAVKSTGYVKLKGNKSWQELDNYLLLTWPTGNDTWAEPSLQKMLEKLSTYEPKQFLARYEKLFAADGLNLKLK